MEHIQIKKPIKIAIICLAALIAAGAVAGASYWAGLKNGAQAQTCQTCPATISESGVAVKCAYKANCGRRLWLLRDHLHGDPRHLHRRDRRQTCLFGR
jgi:hypothetical protein